MGDALALDHRDRAFELRGRSAQVGDGGVLFTLVSAPPGEVTPELTRELAASIVRAGLGD